MQFIYKSGKINYVGIYIIYSVDMPVDIRAGQPLQEPGMYNFMALARVEISL